MFKDRRKHKRRVLQYPASIALDADKQQGCILLDISEGGAKLQVTDSDNIPDHFILIFSKQGSPRRACKVVWKAFHLIGVQFETHLTGANVTTLVEV